MLLELALPTNFEATRSVRSTTIVTNKHRISLNIINNINSKDSNY